MFLSCVATQQKSSSRGSPMCVTTNFMSGNEVAAVSTSPISKASLSRGQTVGPLWATWTLIPSSRLFSRNSNASGDLSRQPRHIPHVFLRAEGFRVVIEAIDPTLGEVGPQPILLRRVPNVEVVVDDEQVLLLSIRRLGSDHEESPLTLGRMNGLARLKPILADGGRVRGLGRLAPMAALSLPLLGLNGNPKSKKSYLA